VTHRVLDLKHSIILDLSKPHLDHPEHPGLLEELHHHYDPDRLYCIGASQNGGPACPGFMTIVKERGRLHARHINKGERVETPEESDLHKAIKERTARVVDQAGHPVQVEDVAQHGKRKTDVTFEAADGRRIGVEVQLSAITRGSTDHRTQIAIADGLTPLWVVADENAMPIDRAPWARLEAQHWKDISRRDALPIRGGVKVLEMIPCEWKTSASCPQQADGGRCGGWHGQWRPARGLYYDDAIVKKASGELVPLYMPKKDGSRGWHMWVSPEQKAEFLAGRPEPVAPLLNGRDVELPDLAIRELEEDDECHWGEESDYEPVVSKPRDSGEAIDASHWVSKTAPADYPVDQVVGEFEIPGDLIALQREWDAAEARRQAFSRSLPKNAEVAAGHPPVTDEQRTQLEAERANCLRWTLSAIDNNKLVMTAPKTSQSRAWVALSPRVHKMLSGRKGECFLGGVGGGFVFHRPDGRPLHPEYVLNHFHYLAREAGLPRCSVHDLRHLMVTIAITEGVDLAIVSKTARHRTLSTTANVYAHLTRRAARQAVDAIAKALEREEERYDHATTTSPPVGLRRVRSRQYGKAA
jgi:hypothetical protein